MLSRRYYFRFSWFPLRFGTINYNLRSKHNPYTVSIQCNPAEQYNYVQQCYFRTLPPLLKIIFHPDKNVLLTLVFAVIFIDRRGFSMKINVKIRHEYVWRKRLAIVVPAPLKTRIFRDSPLGKYVADSRTVFHKNKTENRRRRRRTTT